ncbi:MAG TPA: primosomal protein N' [Gemmatimonadales bacterium]|nr:primosomal protein N' [Gemmatimonadales bacterium]
MSRYAQVALPLPLAATYSYGIPAPLHDRVAPGARVLIPIRGRRTIGIVVAVDDTAPAVAVREILDAPDAEPAIPHGLLETARWIAGYYGAPIGLTLKALLPAAMWDTEDRTAAGRTERVVSLPAERLTLLERDAAFGRKHRQRALYQTLEELGGSAAARHLRDQLGFSDAVIRALIQSGLAREEAAEWIRDPFADTPATPPPSVLTAAQQQAVNAIDALAPGQGALLQGVTGSGKTAVYLEAVRHALMRGRGAIVLVPEIGLTPQTVSRLRGAFGDDVAVLHSALSDGERADAWRLLRRGERRVAVGARSAIFAPVANLGIIVVDEEHESSYKNGESPRYHARDVAAVRARLEGATLVLGSATPSLESLARVPSQLNLLRLPERIGGRPLPPVELIDLRHAPLVAGLAPLAWSEALDAAVVAALARGEQALLLLNRRGYAAFLQCPDCGEVWECPHCSISLTVHQAPACLRCHYCDHQEPMPYTCRACASPVQVMRGIGTQQLERLLAERFPTARLARMDLDTTSTKWSHQRILGAVERGEVDLLLGTQMIAKGLDFPNVTLVGVVDADTGLHLPDFRSAERTFQLLAQVAGRAGRGPRGGRVLVQTRNPTHYALTHSAQHDTDGFLREERRHREAPAYPPSVALVNLVVTGESEREVSNRAAAVADWCERLIAKQRLPLTALGPAPCPLARIKGRWRWHLLIKGPPDDVGRLVRYAAPRLQQPRGIRIILDRDPVSVL